MVVRSFATLFLLAAACGLFSIAAADHCTASNISDVQRFDPVKRWHFEDNTCDFHRMREEELVTLLRGKSILFIGDSSVRNTGLALLASMCNPDHLSKCDQIMTLPFIEREGSSNAKGAFRCGEGSPTNHCDEIKYRFTPLANLTMNEFYKTHEERRKFWKTKNIPPLLSMSFRGVEMHILEAGCSNHRDGLWVVLDYLLKYNVPFRYDMIVLSGGLHCSYRIYKGGTWYRSLFERFPKFRKMGVPLVWVEVTHCLKNDGGHFFKMEGKWMLNYRKLAACSFIDKHVPYMRSGAIRNGAAFVYTRHITQNLTLLGKSKYDKTYKFNEAQRDDPCPFMDPIHPTVECYGAIAQSLAHTVRDVVRNTTNFATLEPLQAKETLAEAGAVQFGDSFLNSPQHIRGGNEAEIHRQRPRTPQDADGAADAAELAIMGLLGSYSQMLMAAVSIALIALVVAWRRKRRRTPVR